MTNEVTFFIYFLEVRIILYVTPILLADIFPILQIHPEQIYIYIYLNKEFSSYK